MSEPTGPARVHLRAAGVSLVLSLPEQALPEVLHWGADLGDGLDSPDALAELARAIAVPYVDSVVMMPPSVAILPEHAAGWLGRPGVLGSRAGRDWSPAFDHMHHQIGRAHV